MLEQIYTLRNLNSEDKVQYRPQPGIKDLTSEFISTNKHNLIVNS